MRGLRRSLLNRGADARLRQRTAPIATGVGLQQPHAPGVAQHNGAVLEEFQPDRANIGAGQFADGQGNSADCIKQHIGQHGEQHQVLIGSPFGATGVVGKQIQLNRQRTSYSRPFKNFLKLSTNRT